MMAGMDGYLGSVTFTTTTVPVHDGEAKIPGRYPHHFASTPIDWRTVQTHSKYVVFPSLPPGAAGHMRYFGAEIEDDTLDVWGERMVYGMLPTKRDRWYRFRMSRLDWADRIERAWDHLRGRECE